MFWAKKVRKGPQYGRSESVKATFASAGEAVRAPYMGLLAEGVRSGLMSASRPTGHPSSLHYNTLVVRDGVLGTSQVIRDGVLNWVPPG